MPKEMLPILDKPVIQYVVEEAVAAGCDEILIVTGRGKRAIEDHFDHSFELEHHLRDKGKRAMLDTVRAVSELADIHYVRQKEPLGLGHAVSCAERFVSDEPFAVLLGDDIFRGAVSPMQQLVEVHKESGSSCFSVTEVPRDQIHRYGSVQSTPTEAPGVHRVIDLIEKPAPEDAPSLLATMGRYVFTGAIFQHLQNTTPGYGGEIQLTDAMRALCQEADMYAVETAARRLDVGSVLGFLEANLVVGSEDPATLEHLRRLLAAPGSVAGPPIPAVGARR